MSKNCLKTTLKAVINNDNLKELGMMYANITNTVNDYFILTSIVGKSVEVSVVGNGYLGAGNSAADARTDLANNHTAVTIESTSASKKRYIAFSSSVKRVKIKKYNVSGIEGNRAAKVDLSSADGITIESPSGLKLGGSNASDVLSFGDISYLRNANILSGSFDLGYCKDVYGDLSAINISNCTTVITISSGVSLDIDTAELNSVNTLTLGRYSLTDFDGIIGQLSSLPSNCPNLQSLHMRYCHKVTGSLQDIGCTSITSINFTNTPIPGSVEAFVAAQVTAGRSSVGSSAPVSLRLGSNSSYNNISFGSIAKLAADYNYITWESASKIAVYYGASSLANCTTVYTMGYSDGEIATNWPGKTVIKVDA